MKNLEAPDHRLILRAKHASSWLTMWFTTVNVTVLVATEFSDFGAHVMMLPLLTLKKMRRLLSVLFRTSRT